MNTSWQKPHNEPLSVSKLEDYLMEIFVEREKKSSRPRGYVGPVGDGWYRLPGGGLTREGGFKMFSDILRETAADYLKADEYFKK